ncbi:AcrR family transcriptional regulator [Alkalibacillus flavidus]|uniref:AcrR family transcriptional regulator n=1 Tax=Alkalibacillus flavidus TaxID=546021 RepID=A0ABV2KWW5_9BACI
MKVLDQLDGNKRMAIINAALQEFTEKGFDKASTNHIVKTAGIGKGTLFYYFHNKQDLFDSLIEYCIGVIQDDFLAHIDFTEPDFIERMRQVALLKLEVQHEQPYMFYFFAQMLIHEEPLPEGAKAQIDTMQERNYAALYNNVDLTMFRDDLDHDKAMELIRWSIEGYQQQLLERIKGESIASLDFATLTTEFETYLNTLKTAFYQ